MSTTTSDHVNDAADNVINDANGVNNATGHGNDATDDVNDPSDHVDDATDGVKDATGHGNDATELGIDPSGIWTFAWMSDIDTDTPPRAMP